MAGCWKGQEVGNRTPRWGFDKGLELLEKKVDYHGREAEDLMQA
jgi:hypothetical protein